MKIRHFVHDDWSETEIFPESVYTHLSVSLIPMVNDSDTETCRVDWGVPELKGVDILSRFTDKKVTLVNL